MGLRNLDGEPVCEIWEVSLKTSHFSQFLCTENMLSHIRCIKIHSTATETIEQMWVISDQQKWDEGFWLSEWRDSICTIGPSSRQRLPSLLFFIGRRLCTWSIQSDATQTKLLTISVIDYFHSIMIQRFAFMPVLMILVVAFSSNNEQPNKFRRWTQCQWRQ